MENEKRTDDREQDLPDVNDPRVFKEWKDIGDGCRVLMRKNGSIEFKPCGLEDVAKSVSYYEFFPELIDYHMSEIGKIMKMAYGYIFTIEERITKSGKFEPMYENFITMAQKLIEKADFHVEVAELYMRMARNSFPWLDPRIPNLFDKIKKIVQKEKLKVRRFRLKNEQKA